jgi:hypothetical protein
MKTHLSLTVRNNIFQSLDTWHAVFSMFTVLKNINLWYKFFNFEVVVRPTVKCIRLVVLNGWPKVQTLSGASRYFL